MQTTPGTPLSGDEPPAPAPTGRKTALIWSIAAAVVVLDQLSKIVIVATMPDRQPIELLGGLLTITYGRNSGAAFSLGQGLTVVFTVVAIGVVVGGRADVSAACARPGGRWPWACLVGGALGNLVDRIFRAPGPGRGEVVDWIQFPNYPVFNLADSFVVCSAIAHRGALVARHRLGWRQHRRIRRGGLRGAGVHRPHRPPGPHPHRPRGPGAVSGLRSLPVPEGLEGERVDAALARLFGVSRTKAADLAASGRVTLDGAAVGKSDRVHCGGWLEVDLPGPGDSRRGSWPSRCRACASCTTTTTWSWSTSRSGSRPTRARAGAGPPWSAAWPAPATGSRPAGPPSGRAWCTASMSARAA